MSELSQLSFLAIQLLNGLLYSFLVLNFEMRDYGIMILNFCEQASHKLLKFPGYVIFLLQLFPLPLVVILMGVDCRNYGSFRAFVWGLAVLQIHAYSDWAQ